MLEQSDLQSLEENLPFWKKVSDDERKVLMDGTIRFTHGKGEIVHDDRNICTGLLMVVSGQLRVYIISETGKEITLYRLFERDICVLSASCLIRNITFDVHVQAEKKTTIFMSFDRRLAMHLLEQAAIAGQDSFAATHEAIARDLGTAREVVTRMLSRFQDDKLVNLSRGGITLTDRDGLYALT
jgi:CRP/FNR family transcriptional regulator